MLQSDTYQFQVTFPGGLEYIPAVRKYVSEMLLAINFGPKFAYRSEIIVDEICNNAVAYGCVSVDAVVELLCTIQGDRIEFVVKDEGGRSEDLKRLTEAVKKQAVRDLPPELQPDGKRDGLGLEIVRMLSDEVVFEVAPENVTKVRVVKIREEDTQEQEDGGQAADEGRL